MKRRTCTEIERGLKHSLTAIKRYIYKIAIRRDTGVELRGSCRVREGDKLSMNTQQSIYAPLPDKMFETIKKRAENVSQKET